MRISDWSSDVCSSDLATRERPLAAERRRGGEDDARVDCGKAVIIEAKLDEGVVRQVGNHDIGGFDEAAHDFAAFGAAGLEGQAALGAVHLHEHRARSVLGRSEEHTSELQSLMRISYAVFCLKQKTINQHITRIYT